MSVLSALRPMAEGSWLCLPIDAPPASPVERVDLQPYDQPRYYVVPGALRPIQPAEQAPYDLDVIRLDLAAEFDGQDVWAPVRAGDTIPARVAHLPRRRCDHAGCCSRLDRLGQVLVQVTALPGDFRPDRIRGAR